MGIMKQFSDAWDTQDKETEDNLLDPDCVVWSHANNKGFTKEEFAKFHPGGMLGKKLTLKVEALISQNKPLVYENATIQEVIIEISRGRLGATVVCDIQNRLKYLIEQVNGPGIRTSCAPWPRW